MHLPCILVLFTFAPESDVQLNAPVTISRSSYFLKRSIRRNELEFNDTTAISNCDSDHTVPNKVLQHFLLFFGTSIITWKYCLPSKNKTKYYSKSSNLISKFCPTIDYRKQ